MQALTANFVLGHVRTDTAEEQRFLLIESLDSYQADDRLIMCGRVGGEGEEEREEK